MRPTPISVLLAFASIGIAQIGIAQIDRSALTGTIRDQAGGAVPGARVRAVRPASGLVRETISGPGGAYTIPELPAGTYTVTFTKAGFATLRLENVDQAIGATHTLNATLSLAQRDDEITVSATPVPLDQTTASVGGRMEKKQVLELPLNGRNWSSLTTLVPGAIDSGGSNMKSVRFAGRGLDDNNFTLDGVDATGIVNQAQRGQGRMTISVDSIAEFRVESALYSSELGGSPGGQISITSPSGANNLHGSLYEYLRNDLLDARSPFDPASPPPFRLNQFGGSLGGPIARNNTFFTATTKATGSDWGRPSPALFPAIRFGPRLYHRWPKLRRHIRGVTALC